MTGMCRHFIDAVYALTYRPLCRFDRILRTCISWRFLGEPQRLMSPQGLLDVGKIKAGETLVVSGAAGATGSVVCQIGKKLGAKVYAIAGSQDKCEWLEKDLGVEKAFNYKSPTFHADFRQAVGYLDVYFDNVGGDMLNFMLTRLKMKARIVLCGKDIFRSNLGT